MTVSTTLNKITYTSDGVTTVYPFTFAVRPSGISDIQVFETVGGVITQLTLNTQYVVAINAAIAPNPTPVGGTVTLTTAAPNGSLITIMRTMALTQSSSLANQGTLYQPVLETMDDVQTMLVQQIAELYGRAIVASVSDPAPNPLPPVAQRANQALGFDSLGNPIALSIVPSGVISSAMAPVVAASTIAQALSLLGLTGVQPEPPGVVKAFAGSTAPTGYLMCNGQPVSRFGATAALFAVISTTYGAGDGSTTFNVPDLRGRTIAGLDNMGGAAAAGRLTSNTIIGGATNAGNANGMTEQNTIATAQLPSHFHNTYLHDPGHSHTLPFANVNVGSTNVNVPITGTSAYNTNPAFTGITPQSAPDSGGVAQGTANQTATTGSGNPINNVQPTMVMNWIIKT